MTVEELISYLQKSPQDNIVIVELGNEQVEIEDVLLGQGTLKGFTYIILDGDK